MGKKGILFVSKIRMICSLALYRWVYLVCKSCFSSKCRLAQLSTNSRYENSRMTGITSMTGITRMTGITGMTEMNWTNRVTGTTGMTTKDDLDD